MQYIYANEVERERERERKMYGQTSAVAVDFFIKSMRTALYYTVSTD